MINLKPKQSKLDLAIDVLLGEMLDPGYAADDWAKMIEQLTKLYKLKEQDSRSRPSADTLLIVGANIVGIILIIGHERASIITTKALGFIMRLK
jgi:hypothetical protein